MDLARSDVMVVMVPGLLVPPSFEHQWLGQFFLHSLRAASPGGTAAVVCPAFCEQGFRSYSPWFGAEVDAEVFFFGGPAHGCSAVGVISSGDMPPIIRCTYCGILIDTCHKSYARTTTTTTTTTSTTTTTNHHHQPPQPQQPQQPRPQQQPFVAILAEGFGNA